MKKFKIIIIIILKWIHYLLAQVHGNTIPAVVLNVWAR